MIYIDDETFIVQGRLREPVGGQELGLETGRQGPGRFREPDPERGRDLLDHECGQVLGRCGPGRMHGPEHEPGLEPRAGLSSWSFSEPIALPVLDCRHELQGVAC